MQYDKMTRLGKQEQTKHTTPLIFNPAMYKASEKLVM